MIDREKLKAYCEGFGVLLSPEQLDQFDGYCRLLLEWNKKMNLTAIREPEEVLIKHFVDSLALLRFAELPQGAKLIDVGTGAGFPGLPLKIARPDLRLVLLDSLKKRLTFLQAVCDALGLDADIIHSRAEDGGKLSGLRQNFDAAVSRAVAPLNLLAEYCLPFVRVGGIFLAAKGPQVKEELSQAEKAFHLLGGRAEKTAEYFLPDGSGRTLVTVKKERATPALYPRHGSKIAKKPL